MRKLAVSLFVALALGAAVSGQHDPKLYSALTWRSIGPFRAGRASAVAGVAGNPAVYYFGTPGGGVWKTTDGGMIWKPISDAVPVASIGAIGVAPSNPDIVYVGTGDVSEVGGSVNAGRGVYKSVDAGSTWTHIGLEHTWHIGALWIDPKNSDIVVVAALGTRSPGMPIAASTRRPTAARAGERRSTGTRKPARSTWRSRPTTRRSASRRCGTTTSHPGQPARS
jgi:hypothetical protein